MAHYWTTSELRMVLQFLEGGGAVKKVNPEKNVQQ